MNNYLCEVMSYQTNKRYKCLPYVYNTGIFFENQKCVPVQERHLPAVNMKVWVLYQGNQSLLPPLLFHR